MNLITLTFKTRFLISETTPTTPMTTTTITSTTTTVMQTSPSPKLPPRKKGYKNIA
jgi:hypothetical protein